MTLKHYTQEIISTTMNMCERMFFLVTLCVLFCLKDVGAEEMSKEDLIHVYENSSPGQLVCYYHGSYCTRGHEYCSVVDKTCISLFPKNASEETKLNICADILEKNETEPGVLDTCIYFLGEIESRRVIRNQKESPHSSPHPLPVTGKELCPYPDKYCQRGIEFCNITSKNCEQLFPPGLNDTEKRQRCEEVTQNNVTMLWDACIYALGLLRCSKSNATGQKSEVEANNENVWRIPYAVVLVIVFLVGLIVAAAVAAVLFIRHQKLLRFKQTSTPAEQSAPPSEQSATPAEEPKPTGNKRHNASDVDKENEKNKKKLLVVADDTNINEVNTAGGTTHTND